MKKLMFLFVLLITLISCDKEENTPFYRFSEVDFQFLPQEYNNVGQVYKFRNQNNEDIQLRVASYDLRKITGGGIGTPHSLFYYEELEIVLDIVNPSNENCDTMKILAAKQQENFLIWVSESESFFPCSNSQNWQTNIERPFVTFEMMIQGNIFDKVVTLFDGQSNIGFYPGFTIDLIHYDLDKGFIGFDDRAQNAEFRIIQE